MSRTEKTDNPTVEHLQKLHRWRTAFFGLVILVAGLAIGAASTLILAPGDVMPPPPSFERIIIPLLNRMEHDLRLSAEQKDQLQPILKTHTEKIANIHEEACAEINEQWTQMNEQIFAMLTERQQEMWQRRLEDVQGRFRGGLRRGGPRYGNGGPGLGYRRGQGEADRFRKGPGPFGPGRRPDDPNRPRRGPGQFGPGWRPDDPNRPQRDVGRDPNRSPRGPGWHPEDPNRPRNGFGRDPMPDRLRRGPGRLGPGRPPAGPNLPQDDPNQTTIKDE